MGASLAAILTRMVRTAMLEELGQDYIRTARAKGLSERAVVCRHALPNALVPIITVVGLQFGALLAGAIVTETIFSWPGLGRLTVSAISNRDYALVQGCLLSIGLTYVLVNLLTDVVYRWVNPRMRDKGRPAATSHFSSTICASNSPSSPTVSSPTVTGSSEPPRPAGAGIEVQHALAPVEVGHMRVPEKHGGKLSRRRVQMQRVQIVQHIDVAVRRSAPPRSPAARCTGLRGPRCRAPP